MTAAIPDDKHKEPVREGLEDALHALAQPLTALLFLLELGVLHTDPQFWQSTLHDARTECLRAIQALDSVRSAAQIHPKTGDLR